MPIGLNTAQIIDRARGKGISLSEQEADSILSQSFDPSQYGADPGAVDSLLSARSSSSSSPDDYLNTIKQSVLDIIKPRQESEEKFGKYLQDNPFTFDEALARASAEERFDPFYQAELRDFEEGINKARGRTSADEEALRKELTTQTENFVGRTRRQIDEALEASKEGFAGAGLFFGGERLKREGRTQVSGEEEIGDFVRGQDLRQQESQLRQDRTFEDIASREKTTRRTLGAARETDILTDVSGQRAEEEKRRLYEAGQYAGAPISSSSGISSLLLGI